MVTEAVTVAAFIEIVEWEWGEREYYMSIMGT